MHGSQLQVDDEFGDTFRDRIGLRLSRLVEPLAHRLVDWCRAIDRRADALAGRVGSLGAEVEQRQAESDRRQDAHEESFRSFRDGSERRAGLLLERVDHAEARLAGLEERAEAAYWGREALVERINGEEARAEILLGRIDALDGEANRLNWGREALVERLNASDARMDHLLKRLERLTDRVDEHVPMPLAFDMDAMAMGRRLAALEDQVERLTRRLGEARDDPGTPSVVAFPGQDKAAG